MDLSAGARLGSYQIVSALGAGGMGEVYRAKDTKLNREVALKILPETFTHDPERLARFRREAQVLASLNHPHIGAIYGLDEANPSPGLGQAAQQFLVLELVDGETLDKRIARGPIPVDEALPIARQIAEALEAAHEKGIIHRDLKPSNIALTGEGQVKVLDFGLAKLADPVGAGLQTGPSMLSQSPTITSPAMMTGVGMILGTAAYMSPEQAKGRPADKRCDVWAFACVVYEMLTGRRAFEGEDVSDTLAAVLRGTPDWSALPGETPPMLRRLLARCLAKDHVKRLRDLGDARIEIDEALAGPDDQPAAVSPAVTSRSSRSWLAWAGWVAVAVLASSWMASSWLRTQPEPRLVQFQITAPPNSRLPLGTPALSPDGRMLVYRVTTPSGENILHLRNLDSQDAHALAGTEGANHPIWSPDSRSLGFWVQGKVKRFDLADGSSLELAATPNVWSLTWSRQGLVLFLGERGLSVVSASGGSAHSASYGSDSTKQTPVIDEAPQFLSDGKRFLIASRRADGPMWLDLATLDSSERKTVVEQTSGGAMVARTPHGESYLLYAKGTALVAHRFDESAGRVIGAPESIVQDVGKVGGGLQVATMTVSDTGTLAYQRAGNAMGDRLVWIDRHGKEVGEMPAAVVGSPRAISPDGRYVAMNKSNQLWSLDLSRQVATQLTFGGGEVNDAVWSPDGRRVAFQRDAGIYEKDSSGSGGERLLVPGRFRAISSWSPDGRYVLVSEGPRMFMVPLDGDGKRLGAGSPSGTSREGVFSPDGKFIAYTSDESGRAEVYVQPVPPAEGKWKMSSEGGDRPSWRKDGKELFFRSNSGITAIGVKSGSTFEPAVPQRLFANISSRGYVATTDGERFLMALVVEVGTDSPITVVLNWFLMLSNRDGSRP